MAQETRYFKYFKVNLEKECPFWVVQKTCGLSGGCSVCECDENEVSPPTSSSPSSLCRFLFPGKQPQLTRSTARPARTSPHGRTTKRSCGRPPQTKALVIPYHPASNVARYPLCRLDKKQGSQHGVRRARGQPRLDGHLPRELFPRSGLGGAA